MKLGFISAFSEERLCFAKEAGFDGIEASVDSGGPLDLGTLTADKLEDVRRICREQVGFLTIQCAPNHLASDQNERERNNAYFIEAIRTCKKLGVDVIMTNAWADREKSPAENLAVFKESFTCYADAARAEGVRIAIENCPHWSGYPAKVGNIAFSPEMWEAMFMAVPSEYVGLEFDPSHLFWQGIDIDAAIREFGRRIYAFHAKDTEIDRRALGRRGIIGRQINRDNDWESGWWRYRIPGWGEVDWLVVFRALYDIGFDGPVVIEHEDPVFSGDRTDEGLKKGLDFLKRFRM